MPTIPTCLIIDITVTTPNRGCTNRLYATTDQPPAGVTNMQQAADILFQELRPFYVALMPASCFFYKVRTQWTSPTLDLEAFSSENPAAGTAAGDPLPDEVCAVIQRRTSNRGRQNRGRIFISGISEILQEKAGFLTGPGKTALKNLATAIGEDMDISVSGMGLAHWRHWDRKANALDIVTQTRAMDVLMSRRDRRQNLVPRPL